VTTVKIATAAVTTDKIAPRAVTGNKINQMGATHGQVLTWMTGSTNDWIPTSVSAWAWALTGNSITGTEFLGTTNNQPLVIRTNNTERMRVTSGGNIGIGTTNPTNLLHVTASSNPVRIEGLSTDNTLDNIVVVDANGVMKIRNATSLSGTLGWSLTGNSSTNPSTNFLGTTDAVDLVVRTNNTERLRVTSSGKVGIGTASPTTQLDVAGTANVSGNTSIGGSATITGDLTANGNVTLGDASADQLVINAQIGSHLIPNVTNTYDVGSSTLRWRDGWYSGTVTATGVSLIGFTLGSVLFIGSGGALSENNANFFWDNTNARLGLGTTTPTHRLHVHAPSYNAINITSSDNTGAGTRFDATSNGGSTFTILSTGTLAGAGAGKLGFFDESAGLYRAVIDGSTGHVGVGTTAPSQRLHVDGGQIAVTGSSTPPGGGPGLQLGSINGSYRWIQSYDNQPLAINPLGNNVGIRTTNPTVALQIAEDNAVVGGGQLAVSGQTNQNKQTLVGFNTTGNYGQIQAVEQGVAVRPLALNPAGGNVGVGTTNPSVLLHVAGNVRIDDNTQLGDATSDNVTFIARVNSDIHPATDATYDLGSNTLRWRDGWFSGTVTSQNATVTSLTPGSVVFAGIGGALSQNNTNFFWDNMNTRLGIGTNSPTAALDLRPENSERGLVIRAGTTPTDNLFRIESNSGQYRWRVDQNFDLFVTDGSGTDRAVWKNTGSIGIGTISPATHLHANSTTNGAVYARFTNANVLTGFDVGIANTTGIAELRMRDNAALEMFVNDQRALRLEPTQGTTNEVPNIIGGHSANAVTAGKEGAFIGGGMGQSIQANFAVIVGGNNNVVSGDYAGILAGTSNNISGERSVIGAGSANDLQAEASLIGAGSENTINTGADFSAIVAGTDNGTGGIRSFIGAGRYNSTTGENSGILAGVENSTSGTSSMAIGSGLLSKSYREVVVGSYNSDYTPNSTTAWNATDRLFVVGNGQDGTTRSDALIIWKNGDAQLFGTVILGDATSDNVTFTARVNSHIHPATNATYDLGSNTLRWRDGWFSGTVTSQNATVTSLTPGSVVFAGTGGALSQNNTNFYWDNTNTRLGVGTNAPLTTLHVAGTGRFDGQLTVTSGGAFITGNSSVTGTLGVSSDVNVGGDLTVQGNTQLGDAISDNVTFIARVNSHIHPATNATYDLGSNTLRWRDGWFSGTVTSSNVTVTSLTPGSVVFAGTGGALSQNNTNFYWDNTNGRLGIGTNAPTQALHVVGQAVISNDGSIGGNLSVTGFGTFGSGLTVSSGGATITGASSITGATTITGTLSVSSDATISGTQVSVPNIPSSSTATDVVVWNSNNLERRAANGLISTYAWMLGGNAITNPATEWIGTSSSQPFVVRSGGTQTLQFNTNGSIQRDNSGNTRGSNAIDLQITRSSSSQVASGSTSVITGGTNNTASGAQSFVGAGDNNTASQQNAAVVAGISNTAGGAQSFVGGGQSNQANGSYSTVAGGQGNVAQGQYSAIPGGFNMKVGDRSFGFSGQTSGVTTDLSGSSQIAAFVDVDLWLYNVRNQASQLRFYEPSSAGINYTAFQAPSLASDIVYTLPSSIPIGGGFLQTDGSGNLSWNNGSGSFWSLTGNASTNPANHFIGTTDAQPLVVRTNNIERMRVTSSGILQVQNQASGTPTTELQLLAGNSGAGASRLVVRAGTAQSVVNLFEWRDNTNNLIGVIDPSGFVGIGISSSIGAYLHVKSNGAQPAAIFEDGTVQVGSSGDPMNTILHGTVSVDPPNIGANSSGTVSVTITGVQTGDRVFLTPPYTFEDELIFQGAAITGANTVTLKIRNVSGSAVDGSAQNWNYMVIRP